jgi:hypothetical protein
VIEGFLLYLFFLGDVEDLSRLARFTLWQSSGKPGKSTRVNRSVDIHYWHILFEWVSENVYFQRIWYVGTFLRLLLQVLWASP